MNKNQHGSPPANLERLERDPNANTALQGKRALILVEDPEVFTILHENLFAIGIVCWEARCLAGASALLRREETMQTPADFLFADEKLGGVCGMSLCSALVLPLRRRPMVLLATKGKEIDICLPLEGSCINAIFDYHTPAVELGVLLTRLLK